MESVAGSPILTPEGEFFCPGDKKTFSCVVTYGDRLYWEVDLMHPTYSNIGKKRFSTTDQPGSTIHTTNNIGHTFHFTLISTLPFNSTVNTIAAPYLNGAQIKCEDTSSVQATVVVYVVDGKLLIF